MYRKLCLVALAAALTLTAARANDILQITETGNPTNNLVGTYNGNPLNLLVAGAFTAQLPSGYLFSNNAVGLTAYIISRDDPTFEDQFSIPNFQPPVFLALINDTFTGITAGNTFTLANAGTNPNGSIFDLVLSNGRGAQSTPETGSTIMLLGSAIVAMGAVTRRWMR